MFDQKLLLVYSFYAMCRKETYRSVSGVRDVNSTPEKKLLQTLLCLARSFLPPAPSARVLGVRCGVNAASICGGIGLGPDK